MLGDAVAAELPALRREAESLMVDSCRVTTDGTPVWDDATGTYTPAAGATVYEGRCRLRKPSAAPRDVDSGEAGWAVDDLSLSLPVVAGPNDIGDPGAVANGHAVEMLSSANDPAAVGLLLEVQAGHWQSQSTARRLPCKVVTRDA